MPRGLNAIVVIALLFSACQTAPEIAPEKRPNIVVFFVDDMGWTDLGVFGSDLYQTPEIDRLAADGVRFTNAYSACTVCSPSRAALLTGMYPARTRLTDFIRGHPYPYAKLLPPEWTMKIEHRRVTVAEALREAGYKTAHIGKWHLMPRLDDDEMDHVPERHGFDINVGGGPWGLPGSYFHPFTNERGIHIGPLPSDSNEGDYLTDVLTAEALRIIGESRDEPFFLNFWFHSVHTPIQAKEEDIARFAPLVKDGMRHTGPTYAAMVASVDRGVGLVREKLEELGLTENTAIIFTSDNGGLDQNGKPTENHPLRAGKGSAYEGGVRVPAIIYWPGVTPKGAASNEPVITPDLYPTILEVAGVRGDTEHNAKVDGVSLGPLLRNPSAELERDAIYWHYPHYHPGGAEPYSAIRSGNYRLVEFHQDNRIELYNLNRDIGETENLANELPDKAAELRGKLHAWRQRLDAQMPTPNPNHDPARESERGPYVFSREDIPGR